MSEPPVTRVQLVEPNTEADYEAIRRTVIEHLMPESFSKVEVLFLEVEDGEDPSDELLVHFVNALFGKVSVRPASDIRHDYAFRPEERGTGRRGFRIAVREIKPLSSDHFQVCAAFEGGLLAGYGCYFIATRDGTGWRLISQPGGWIS